MKKRLIALILAAVLLMLSAAPALAAAPKVKETDYEGKGVVEVEFAARRVQYKNLKVVVKDANGKKQSVEILEKDDDDITFRVQNVKPAAKYTYTISGVRKGSSGSYGTVKGSFRTPGTKPKIKEVEYDGKNRELEVEFATRVQFKNLKVVVKDESGTKLKVGKPEKGKDDLELKVKGIVPGRKYTVIVFGVRVKGKGGYVRVSKKFVA